MSAPICDGANVAATGGRPGNDGEHHCITCSDEGVPMRIAELLGPGLAQCVDTMDRRSEVMTGLVGDVAVGDLVLVHAGTAILQLPDSEQAGKDGEAVA